MRISQVVAVYLVFGAMLVACGSSSPTAPSPPPAAVTPPPVVTPPVVTPPPTVTNYAGTWRGNYIVEQCSGSSGSMGDVLCSPPHGVNTGGGIFQPGVVLPVTIELAQNGNAVSGSLSLGQIRGPVSGAVVNNGLVLSGTATYSDASIGLVVTNTITNWNTVLAEGGVMSGTFAFGVKVNVYPGDGVVRVRLSNVRR